MEGGGKQEDERAKAALEKTLEHVSYAEAALLQGVCLRERERERERTRAREREKGRERMRGGKKGGRERGIARACQLC